MSGVVLFNVVSHDSGHIHQRSRDERSEWDLDRQNGIPSPRKTRLWDNNLLHYGPAFANCCWLAKVINLPKPANGPL